MHFSLSLWHDVIVCARVRQREIVSKARTAASAAAAVTLCWNECVKDLFIGEFCMSRCTTGPPTSWRARSIMSESLFFFIISHLGYVMNRESQIHKKGTPTLHHRQPATTFTCVFTRQFCVATNTNAWALSMIWKTNMSIVRVCRVRACAMDIGHIFLLAPAHQPSIPSQIDYKRSGIKSVSSIY